MTRAQVDAAQGVLRQVYDQLRPAYETWSWSLFASTISLSQDPAAPGPVVADQFWDEIGNPLDTTTRAVLATLRHWPQVLDDAWTAYQGADTASADALDLLPVHDEL